jgi:hypothetical protein
MAGCTAAPFMTWTGIIGNSCTWTQLRGNKANSSYPYKVIGLTATKMGTYSLESMGQTVPMADNFPRSLDTKSLEEATTLFNVLS